MLTLSQFKDKMAKESLVNSDQLIPNLEFFWCFEMKGSTQDIWQYLSDTSRFNRELGFNNRTQTEEDGKMVVRTRMSGFLQEWIEEPWTWIAGRTIASTRRYRRGMGKTVHSLFHIDDESNPEVRYLYVYFNWQPANSFWNMFLKMTSGLLQKMFAKAFQKIDQHISNATSNYNELALKMAPPALSTEASARLQNIRSQLKSLNLDVFAVDQLCDFVCNGDLLEVEPLRVISLARKWNLDSQVLLKTCLHATRQGLLNISWEVLCPHCRGSRHSAGSLGDLPETAECEVCDVKFSTDQENSIEVVFHAHESIRKVEAMLFCAAEPSKKQHIKIQKLLKASENFETHLQLKDGIYRARILGGPEDFKIEVNSKLPSTKINLFQGRDTMTGKDCSFQYSNSTMEDQYLIIEESWWESQALRPGHLFSLPEFRDLFSKENLNSNVKIYLGEQTILFTDIVASTQMYKDQGDIKAFAIVRSHFQELYKIVSDHRGVVVKTIGDAVMASFGSPKDAMDAAVAIQEKFPADRQDTPIRLRVSAHRGPVLAVKLNTGIDYFGNTVNTAAKIQPWAGASEIAMSDDFYNSYIAAAGLPKFAVVQRSESRETLKAFKIFVAKIEPRSNAA